MTKMITAIVRTSDLKKVETALLAAGIRGLTVIKVKGIGEEKAFLEQDLVAHVKFQVIVPSEDADRVAQVVVDAAHTGCAGDGIVLISPVETFIRIRTKRSDHPQS